MAVAAPASRRRVGRAAYAASTMARPLTLLLVRHGQSEWNALGLMQGQTADIPLTDLGHAQAAAGAAELAALGPRRADLQRPALAPGRPPSTARGPPDCRSR